MRGRAILTTIRDRPSGRGHCAKIFYLYQGEPRPGEPDVGARAGLIEKSSGRPLRGYGGGRVQQRVYPVHLITVEAIMEYRRAIRPEGVLFFHVTNEFLDLVPAISANAEVMGLQASVKQASLFNPPERSPTVWVALAEEGRAASVPNSNVGWKPVQARPAPPWTDRYSSIFSAMSR